MSYKRAPQKLISFSDNKSDLDRIRQDMSEGWAIISLVQNGHYYIGIMEKVPSDLPDEQLRVYIPPRKKIKISLS